MLEYTDLIDTPGRKAKLFRILGYRIRYFGCWIGIIGSNLIRKGRAEISKEIDLKELFIHKN